MNDETFEGYVLWLNNIAMDKARELGSNNALKDMYDAVCAIEEGIKKTAMLFHILGKERFGELGEMLMERELKRTVEEAEEALGGKEG